MKLKLCEISVYEAFRPTLIINKVLGVSRIQNVFCGNIHNLKTRKLYDYNSLILMSVYLLILFAKLMLHKMNMNICMVYNAYALINVLCVGICLYTDETVVSLLHQMHMLECTQISNKTIIQRRTYEELGYTTQLLVVALFIVVFEGYGTFIFYNYPEIGSVAQHINIVSKLLHKILCLNLTVQFMLYINRIKAQFDNIDYRLERLKYRCMHFSDYSDILEECRITYNKLINLIDVVSKSMGLRIFIPIAVAYPIGFLLQFYIILKDEHKGMTFYNVLPLVLYFCGANIVIYAAYDLGKSARKISDTVNSLTTTTLPYRIAVQIQCFHEQILSQQIKLTTAGFITVNKQMLTSIIMGVATYCTLIIQLIEK